MRQLSRWFVLLILIATAVSFVRPAYAQNVTITLSQYTVNAYMGTYAQVSVIVTNNDLIAPFHTITLSLSSPYTGWWPATFTPPTVGGPGFTFGLTATSILSVPIPGPDTFCPQTASPGWSYAIAFTISGQDTGGNPVAVTSASLTVNILTGAVPVTVDITSSKPSYIVGDVVTLTMSSPAPADFDMTVRKPDGTSWATKSGTLPYTFTKTATEPFGTYTAELRAYYCGTYYDTTTFTVGPNTYRVTVTVLELPPTLTTALVVDGVKVADMKGGEAQYPTFPIGTTHTIKVDEYVNGAPNYRYYCKLNSLSVSSEGTAAFSYVTQVYLDVSTNPAGIAGVTASDWYLQGSNALISSVPDEVAGTKGTKYLFAQWIVDGTPREGNGFSIVMDVPHKVVAKYDTMFLLTVVSDYGNPKGGGYYKSGDTATFSVDSPVGIGIQQVLVEWKGDYTGKDPKASVKMDGPKTVTAVWTTSYFQLYIILGAIAAIAVVAALLLWRRRTGPSTVKPPPPPTPEPATQVPETPTEPTEPAEPAPATETTTKQPVSVSLRCTNCGHELKQSQVYCPECGQKQID